jgi:hypothetical protein
MSLNWSVKDVTDYETVCYDENGEATVVTTNLVLGMMAIGMGSITKANADEVGWRFDLYQRMFGPLVVTSTGEGFEPRPINADDVRKHVGLHTNVALETRAKWVKRIIESDFEQFVRNNRMKEST